MSDLEKCRADLMKARRQLDVVNKQIDAARGSDEPDEEAYQKLMNKRGGLLEKVSNLEKRLGLFGGR